MIQATKNPNYGSDKSSSGFSYWRMIFRGLWIIPGATLIIFLIFFSLGRVRLSQTGTHLLTMFIYSACIAIPSMVLVTRVSLRYSARFPRAILLIQAICMIFTAVVGSLTADLILWTAGIVPRGFFWGEFRGSLLFCIVVALLIGLGISTYEEMRYKLQAAELELRTKQVEHERAYKLLAEARLSSLESRIHPHFLFNTLNSIAALIPTDPQRAEDTVGKLASLLRFSLNAQHSGLVPLEQELKVVRDYLEIEATRFGPRLRYEVAVPESLGSVRVPPLSLQTLVENSVKHVAAQRVEGASIEVSGRIEGGRIVLEVADDGPGFSLGLAAPEHGLGNLLARLELLFGSDGRLDVVREQEKTVVRVAFPAES
ncbi:MAG: histidine kinase [Terracidiphilus sp.]|jgi:sensor histidine kinase YesM